MMQLPPLGLYIHMPWCERKCPYCDFNSHEADHIPQHAYVNALLRDLQCDLPLVQDREIKTLFIGGGTPSLFSAAAIDTLLKGISTMVAIADDAEITMEANPGSAEAEKFQALRMAGVNRLSLGIQSFDDRQLQALGRVHNSDEAHRAIEAARRAGFGSFNLDLMHGLPGQDSQGAEDDLRHAIASDAPHVSWYQLTIEPNTVFHKRPPLLPIEDELAVIQDYGEALLADNGHEQYEVSAYSRPGFQCRHNRNYWTFGDYLGIGAGAHGKISTPDGKIERYAKRRQPADYLAAPDSQFVASGRSLGDAELIGEFMMNALRLREGFNLSLFADRTGLPESSLTPKLDSLKERGLLMVRNGSVTSTDLGLRFLDTVVGEFL